MDYKKEFERMMKIHTDIALASSINNIPNVRIVNFYYDSEKKTLYFSSFADNQKVTEFEQNPNVTFTTIPKNCEEHIRVKNGIVTKSEIAIDEIKDKFLAKMPEYIMSIPDILPELVMFEITFDNADVIIDFEHIENINI